MTASFDLAVSEVVVRLHVEPDSWLAPLHDRFQNFPSQQEPVWELWLAQETTPTAVDSPAVTHDDQVTLLRLPSYRGSIDLAACRAEVFAPSLAAAATAVDRVLSYICMQELPRHHNALLLHGAGLVFRNRGLVFAGRSDAGKTTTVRLASGYAEALGDDTVIVSLAGAQPALVSTPFWGAGTPPEMIRRCNRQAPLHALLMLEHGRGFELAPLTPAAAVMALLETEKVAVERVASAAAWLAVATELVDRVPVYRLSFEPTVELWPFLQTQLKPG